MATDKSKNSPDGASFDPLSLGILWDKLISISDEIFSTFYRSCFSLITRESFDLVSGILDESGRLLSQATYGPPSFFYALQSACMAVVEQFSDSIHHGDAFFTNDPWVTVGHLHDTAIIRPIFRNNRLIAFSGTISHLPDIGGSQWSPVKSEIFEEGLRIPPTKFVENDTIKGEWLNLLRSNVRTPTQVIGDLKSGYAANMLADLLVNEFIEEFKIRDFQALAETIFDRTKQSMKSGMMNVPQGIYQRVLETEGIEKPLRIACRIIFDPNVERVKIDFDGTSKATPSAVNATLRYTQGYTAYAIKCVANPTLPNNWGIYDSLDIQAPSGSVLNVKPPSAVGARNLVGHFTSLAVWGALSKQVPDKVMADSGMNVGLNFYGTNGRGNMFSVLYQSNGGSGARQSADGIDTVAVPGNVSYIPVETFESDTDMLILRKELLTDSGGPGKHRGGLGQTTTIRNSTDSPVTVGLFITRTKFPAQGFNGGGAGSVRQVSIDGVEVHPMQLHSLSRDSEITLVDAGGGGFGDPKTRSKDLVDYDVKNGYVSRETAESSYMTK